jgi:hypothetical protein
MAHAILRLDSVTGTVDGARIVSGKYFVSDVATQIDNGMPVEIGALIDGERELHKLTAVTADSKSWGIVSTPEVDSSKAINSAALADWYNEADKPVRVHVVKDHNVVSISAEAFDSVPTVGATIGLGAGKFAVGSTGVGTCIAIDVVDGATLYAIEIV